MGRLALDGVGFRGYDMSLEGCEWVREIRLEVFDIILERGN